MANNNEIEMTQARLSELSERKTKILYAIIKDYLETGEPVGSRTISKKTDLNLSSATIRNEMSDLVEMGYIVQPHTSAGRIPTDKGYRFYVDMLMQDKMQEVEELKESILEKGERLDQVLQQAAKLLANNTNYATMISSPMQQQNRLKFIQLSRIDEEHLVAVIVLGGNVIRNKIIPVDDEITDETLLKLNMLLNTNLNGMSIEQINLGMIAKLREEAGIHREVIRDVLSAVESVMEIDTADMEIYTSGGANIFKYPELTAGENAQEIIQTLEEKQQLQEIVAHTMTDENNKGIQVYIGQETPGTGMKDCSLVTATYELGDGMQGTIGILGPKRMDYEHVLKSLTRLKSELDNIFKTEDRSRKGV